MKICSKCRVPKELDEFDKKGKGLCSHCKECRRRYVMDHYNRNKDYYKQKAKRNNKEYSERFNNIKRSLSCTDCSMSFKDEPFLCDFHHLDPTKKDVNVGELRANSVESILKELEKCIPLCANCHRRRHHGVVV